MHKSNSDYDFSNPTYACGALVEHNPNLTDAQAMALDRCPKCFPNGFKAGASRTFVEDKWVETKKVVKGLVEKGIGGAWL